MPIQEPVRRLRTVRDGWAGETARQKILTLDQLAGYAERARQQGRRVVLAHGTFDLLHMGHVRHLEEARELGDLLLVTVTADRFVNKGPGRPVFTEALRAEMVGALAYVERVAVNDAATAENVIGLVRPDVYVKGADYAADENDVTGKIRDERAAVEAHGGTIHFTHDIAFSSSTLLNRHFDVFEPTLRGYLEGFRARRKFDDFVQMIEHVKDKSVLLIGDAIIDEYHYVSPLGKSPKESLIPTLYRDAERFAGGVIAAANHVASFCRDIHIITCLGDDPDAEELVRASLRPNVTLTVVNRTGAPTTRKRRFVEADYLRKLFEVYFMDDSPLTGALEHDLIAAIAKHAPEYDVVVATDFGHGMITGKVRDEMAARSRFLAVNAQSNSANHGYNLITKYRRADYICIDAPEARLAIGDPHVDIPTIASELLPGRIDCPRLILTHGRHGCVTYDRDTGLGQIPAFTGRAIDTMGAGDAFFAVTSPMASCGHDLEMIGFIGNAVGAIKVGIVGHRRSVEKVPLLKYLNTLLK
jgi:rfaE bifunctional protein nucleotidyltransferase chain/domain